MSKHRQQINLYQRKFRRTKVEFSARLVVQMSLLLALALFATSVYTSRHASKLQYKANSLEQQAQDLRNQIYALGQSNGSDKRGTTKVTIDRLVQTRDTNQQVLSSLRAQSKHGNRLFSSYFEGLARRTLDGLWLQDINISQGGRSIMLTGNTYQADLIPQLIKELKNEPAFRGITFRSATVNDQDSKDGNGALGFSLMTHLNTTASEFK